MGGGAMDHGVGHAWRGTIQAVRTGQEGAGRGRHAYKKHSTLRGRDVAAGRPRPLASRAVMVWEIILSSIRIVGVVCIQQM